jgi:hypothetical protein
MRKDITGARFGSLIVVRCTERKSDAGNLIWLTVCDCGQEREEDGYNLRRGVVTSCKACGRKRTTLASTKHSLSYAAEHRVWTGMKTRCTNNASKSYRNYGGKGISVCGRWQSFENFIEDMGMRPSASHSIDRIDNKGNYEPSNCRWASKVEQALNRSTNVLFEYRGEVKPISVWAAEKGIKYDTLRARITVYGITGDDVFKENLRKKAI